MPAAAAELGLSDEEIAWSRYEWLGVHARFTEVIREPDVGLDQQVHQVLEAIDHAGSPDWQHLGAVTTRIVRDAAARLDDRADLWPLVAGYDSVPQADRIADAIGLMTGSIRVAADFYDGPQLGEFPPLGAVLPEAPRWGSPRPPSDPPPPRRAPA